VVSFVAVSRACLGKRFDPFEAKNGNRTGSHRDEMRMHAFTK
jgi:hypothetical protein